MKIKDMKLALALGFGIASLTPSPTRAQEDRFQALAKSPHFENRPTDASAAVLMDDLLFQRASQIYLWAMPLINGVS